MEEIRQRPATSRRDLFYRLNVVPIHAAAVAGADTATSSRSWRATSSRALLRRSTAGSSPRSTAEVAAPASTRYDWPGNVRELENVIERIVVLNNASQVAPSMLPQNIREGRSMARGGDPSEAPRDPDVILPFTEVEKREIGRALRICGWNVAKAAESLELGQATLYRKIKKYNIRLLRKSRETAGKKG